MKKRTKAALATLILGFLVLTGIWYLGFAPRDSVYDPGENRLLAGAPRLSLESFFDGSFSKDLENWLLDRFWGRGFAMDAAQTVKDSLSIADFDDALAILGNEEDSLAGTEEDEGKLDDLVEDLFTTPAVTQPPETTLPGSSAGGETQPPETTLSTDPNDYPEKPAIVSSVDGKVTRHKSYRRKYVLAVTSVISQVADKLPQGGQLVFTMVPQSSVANSYIASKNQDYFTSETETMVQAFAAENVTAISTAQVLDEYMKRGDYVYFRSDMHWTPQGTYAVYREMAAAAGKTPTAWEDFTITQEENFLGTYYRSDPASYLKENADTLTLVQPSFPLEFRRLTGKDSYKVLPLLDMDARANDRYTVYLGGPAGPWSYVESENGQQENCLVICDSFGLAFVPMVATNYRQTHYMDPRYFDESITGASLPEMLEKYDITDVYVIVGDLHSYGSEFFTKYLYEQMGN